MWHNNIDWSMYEEEELLLKTEAYHVVENYGFYAKCLEKKIKILPSWQSSAFSFKRILLLISEFVLFVLSQCQKTKVFFVCCHKNKKTAAFVFTESIIISLHEWTASERWKNAVARDENLLPRWWCERNYCIAKYA